MRDDVDGAIGLGIAFEKVAQQKAGPVAAERSRVGGNANRIG